MFQKIIVPLDSSDLSERALSVASSIAKAVGGSVSICSSIDPNDQAKFNAYWALSGDMDSGIAALPPEGLVRTEEERRSEMEQYLSKIKADNANLSGSDSSVLTGTPADEILAYAHSQNAGLIVMSSRGRSGIVRGVLGSVTDKLLRSADIPVIVVPSEYEAHSGEAITLIVPLDGSKRSESALTAALPLASQIGATVKVLHFVQMESRYAGMPFNEIGPMKADIDDLTALASAYLDDVCKRNETDGVTLEAEVVIGYPASHISEYSQNVSNGIVVMTSHGRSGLKRMLMGSVTDATLRNSDAPVMVVPAIEE